MAKVGALRAVVALATRELVIALFAVLLLIVPAHAITLEITSGTVQGVSEPIGSSLFNSCFHGGANVSGVDFTLAGITLTGFCSGDPTTNVTFIGLFGSLTLDGATYESSCPRCLSNIFFVFTNAPFSEPPPLDLAHYHGPYQTTFTMTGHTNLGPPPDGADFVGQGIMTIGLNFFDESHQSGVVFERFDFRVPESSTLALLIAALVAAVIALPRQRTKPIR